MVEEIWGYNPATEGYMENAVFSTLSGTPDASTGVLRLNASGIITYDKVFKRGAMEMSINIPSDPASGDSRVFGFKNGASDLRGAVFFTISDDSFLAKAYDANGVEIGSSDIPWDSSWTGSVVRYRVVYKERGMMFIVDDVIMAHMEIGFGNTFSTDVVINKQPMYLYIENENSDNMDVSLITFS